MAAFDARYYGDDHPIPAAKTSWPPSPRIARELADGNRMNNLTRHILGLYQSQPGARRFRQLLVRQPPAGRKTVALLQEGVSDCGRKA